MSSTQEPKGGGKASTLSASTQASSGAPGETRAAPRPTPAADRGEVDVWYGGYTGRSMIASFTLCGLFTLAVTGGALWLSYTEEAYWSLIWLIAFGLMGAIWIFQIFRWGYRAIGFFMRLTNRRLFFDRGFLYPDRGEWEINQLTRVDLRANIGQRLIGTGDLYVYGESKAEPLVVLPGVAQPERVAAVIRSLIEKSAA